VPIDAKLAVPTDLAFETVEVDKVLDALNDPSRANIIILDAPAGTILWRAASRADLGRHDRRQSGRVLPPIQLWAAGR
jgi:hypothetical protein